MPLPQFPRTPDCTLCDLHSSGAKSVCVPTVHYTPSLPPLPTNTALVCVGMNPGVDEDEHCTPFIGPSGKDLRLKYLDGSQLTQACTIYITNAVRCWTPLDEQPKARHQKPCVHAYLFPELVALAALHARLFVLLLGGDACKAAASYLFPEKLDATSLSHFLKNQGMRLPLGERTASVYATYHPSYLLRTGGTHAPSVARHLALLNEAVRGITPLPTRPNLVPAFRPPP